MDRIAEGSSKPGGTPARIGPLGAEAWSDEVVTALGVGGRLLPEPMMEALKGGDLPTLGAILPGSLSTLLRHPRLAGPLMAHLAALLRDSTLEPRWRELMVLRTICRTGFRYEWLWHVYGASQLGISPEELVAITEVGTEMWSPLERDLLAATDQLIDNYSIDDETWSALASQLDERQLMEVPLVVGTYVSLAMTLKSFKLQPDELVAAIDAPPLPNRSTLHACRASNDADSKNM